MAVFWWHTLARRQFSGRVCWWERRLSLPVDRFSEKAVYGPCVLAGAYSHCYGGSLWREGNFRESCAGHSEVAVLWWLALTNMQFTGRVSWWELHHSVVAARLHALADRQL